MILGHGIDIVDLSRIEAVYKKFSDRFLQKFLTPEELNRKPTDEKKFIAFLSKHWAVKEAVSKAVGCGLINGSPLHFNDIVLNYSWSHMPIINMTDSLLNITMQMHDLDKNDLKNIVFHVSTSGDSGVVIASVILEKR